MQAVRATGSKIETTFGKPDLTFKKYKIAVFVDSEFWHGKDWDNLAYESELLISKFTNQPIEKVSEINIADIPAGKEREAIIKQRVNQSFFRSTILSSYNLKCCITGLSISDFLVASHIVPWAKDEKNRLNPHNGLCLNTIHDKAFDKGFITVTTGYKIKISNYFTEFKKDNAVSELFLKYDKQPITLPDKFLPSKEFLEYHHQNIFKK